MDAGLVLTAVGTGADYKRNDAGGQGIKKQRQKMEGWGRGISQFPLLPNPCFHDFQEAFRGVRQREFAAINNAQRLFNLHPLDGNFDQLL